LGKTEIYDVNLSPLGDIACATCHVPYTGFRGQSSFFNATTASQPGGVPLTNATPPEPNYPFSVRNRQSYAYAPFSPIADDSAGPAFPSRYAICSGADIEVRRGPNGYLNVLRFYLTLFLNQLRLWVSG
jgi:hypothetical protein